MRRKKKFTSALSFVLSLLMSFSCIQPVMAAQTVPDVESVSGEAAAQAEENEDTNVSVSAAPAKEETSEAPAETTESTQEESDFDSGSIADLTEKEELKSESSDATEPAALSDPEISPLADTAAYAILYESGELVFQRGSTPDAGKGKVLGTYTGFETKKYTGYNDYAPWYKNKTSIKAVSFKDVVKPVSTAYWFYSCNKLTDADFTNLDTSAVTSMFHMFSYCSSLTSLDVSSFNTLAVTSMDGMFSYCSSLTSLDLSSFNTSAVTSMDGMFYSCSSLTSLDVSSFDTSEVTDMAYMFDDCRSLTSLDLSSFNTSAVTSMDSMCYDCNALETLTLGTKFAFKGDTKLVDATWHGFNTGKEYTTSVLTSTYDGPTMADTYVKAAYAILYNSGELVFQRGSTPDAGKGTVLGTYTGFETKKYDYYSKAPWYNDNKSIKSVSFKSVIKPVSTAYWFYACNKLTDADFTNLDTSAVTSMHSMFNNCSALTSLDVSSFDTSAVTNMDSMFNSCSALTNLDLSSFNTSAVTSMGYMFYQCSSLTSLDVSSFNTSAVTNMNHMFSDCSALTSLDVSSFDTSAVTNMNNMFGGCSALISLDLSSFNTSAVTNMGHMFNGCSALTSLNVSSFNTPAVIYMDNMFNGCSALTSLDVSSFDTSAVTDMDYMFSYCSLLTSLDVSSFNTSAVTSMGYMFKDCNALETLTLGTKFAFKGDTKLVDATWHGINTNKKYTTSVLTSTYDGATMADTYIKCFDIKFDAMGGKSSESKKMGYIGMAFDSLPTAEKRGYDFVGWFTEKQGGTQLLVNQPVTQSTYYAQYTEHKYTITVTNDVAGTMGDKTKDFTFQLKMTGNTPAELHYTKGTETGTLKVTDGVAEFTLSHGENIVLSEIPIGTAYEITEVDGASNGYTVESTNSSGTLTEDTNVSFTNTRNGTVPTSAHTNILISIGLFAIALAGLFWHLRKRKQ